jgi:hypothetical protein
MFGKGKPVYVEAGSDSEELAGVGNEAVAADPTQHVSRDMFTKVQTVFIDIDITATPVELANSKELNVWRLKDNITKAFKKNVAIKNRHLAGEEHLEGNLQRCLPLGFEIVRESNSFPYPMGIEVPGILSNNVHKHGVSVWRTPPHTPTLMVGQSVFDPAHITSVMDYTNYRMCTLEDLKADIRFVEASKSTGAPAHATIAVGSLAHESLLMDLDKGLWQEERANLDIQTIYEPGNNHSVQVTKRMGEMLMKKLSEPIASVAESFINLEDFNVKIVRADAYGDFDSPKGIAGELIGGDKQLSSKLRTDVLQKKAHYSTKVKLDFILF